jgi:hypothetical protein
MKLNLAFTAILCALLVLGGPPALLAQSTQGTILGVVTDAAGANVPGATVTVKNEGTNAIRTVTTGDSGNYRVAGLEAGFYQVTVGSTGFKTFTQTRIDVATAQIKRIDARLEVGDLAPS